MIIVKAVTFMKNRKKNYTVARFACCETWMTYLASLLFFYTCDWTFMVDLLLSIAYTNILISCYLEMV